MPHINLLYPFVIDDETGGNFTGKITHVCCFWGLDRSVGKGVGFVIQRSWVQAPSGTNCSVRGCILEQDASPVAHVGS